MSTTSFDFEKLLIDKRVTLPELSEQTSIAYQTLYAIYKRGKIKMNTLREIEKVFGDLSEYITPSLKNELSTVETKMLEN